MSIAQYRRLTAQRRAWIALTRFGMGPKPGSVSRLSRGPNAALQACLNELEAPGIARIEPRPDLVLPTREQAAESGWGVNNTVRQRYFETELRARYAKPMTPEVGFVERLVLFWSNHFSMMETDGYLRASIGQWERDVIRANVLGKFPDMLKQVMQHQAMITYLNNDMSFGPNSTHSVIARRSGKPGFSNNENLGREILELHTLGEGAGYTQSDVTNLSLALTGWKTSGAIGFYFDRYFHEPGSVTVLGKTYSGSGMDKGLAILHDLALHEKTAKHIAFKLLYHFVSQEPDPAMVETLAAKYLETEGDLKEVAKCMLLMPGSWTAPANRIQLPYVWVIALLRAIGVDAAGAERIWHRLGSPLNALYNSPWSWLTPDGFPDDGEFWLNADALRLRKDAVHYVLWDANRLGAWSWRNVQDSEFSVFHTLLSPATKQAISTVNSSSAQPITKAYASWTIAFMSPEFLYR